MEPAARRQAMASVHGLKSLQSTADQLLPDAGPRIFVRVVAVYRG
jgi:hypothetical protein